ncbi:DUF748 domain-containing protein [Cupriavidus malaysiensis]|uniref:2OG-Fe(II) oxygenase n=1 Tax=Cupriavidus malaysiensis TaxID=367825 RepID=A0ABN4TYV8_9BURK|nr:DUF748 domain-containing protein [Cupriavidus malaysiensis]AOZ10276.1 2OG-Fe(II) oxygenase [Cupriavidus malaysiensis]
MNSKFSMQAAMATPRRRLAVRAGGGIVAALAVFGLAGYFGGPPLLKWQIEKQASAALGRKVTLGGAQVRPFSLGVTLQDLAIFEADGKRPMLTLGSAEAKASLASLWHLAPVVDALHVDALAVHVTRAPDGGMSFDDIVRRFAAQPKAPNAKPARFSVNNIAVTDSSFVFDDQQLKQVQRVDRFTLTLPFLSNLPHDVEIVTRPTLSALVNGTPLALDGTMLPFADSRETHLNLNLNGLDLVRFMPFAPALRDAEVKSALLDSRLTLGFRQQKDTQDIFLGGTVTLRNADIVKHDGSPLLKADRLALDIDRIEPLARHAHLRSVSLEGLGVQALRRPDGTVDLASALLPRAVAPATTTAPAKPAAGQAAAAGAGSAGKAGAKAPASAAAASAPAAQAGAAKAAPGWAYAVDHITLKDARLGLRDEAAPSGPGTLALGPLEVQVDGLSSSGGKPATVEAKLTLAEGQTLQHSGELSLPDGKLSGTLQASGVKPQGFAAWWPSALKSQLGDTAVNAELHYSAAWGSGAPQFTLDKSRVEVAPLYVAATGAAYTPPASAKAPRAARRGRSAAAAGSGTAALPLLRADKVALEGIAFDLAKQSFAADELVVAKPEVAATRDPHGELVEVARIWVAQATGKAAPSAPATRGRSAPAATTGQPAGWKARLGKISLDRGAAQLTDFQPAEANQGRPVVHQYRNIALSTGAVGWPLAPGAVPFKLRADAGRRGSLSLSGSAQPTAPTAQVDIDLREFDMAPLQPYLGNQFNAALRAGSLTVKGRANVSAPAGKPLAARFTGNALVGNVRSVDRLTGDDFLRWRTLTVSGIDFAMDPAKGPMQVGLGKIALSDFYARVILNANGRLNLQDVMAGGAAKGEAEPRTSLTQANPASAPPAARAAASVPAAPAAPASAAQAKAAPAESGPKPQIRIGGVSVDKGNINFSDFFVKPNYTANLTDMTGSVSKVSTADPTPADVVLNGRVDGDAPVNVSGKVNPFSQQLYLDLAAKATGIELTRLTPYAAKYAGYPITKGKLSVDVSYKIDSGKLEAQNHLYLDQLTFGDRVDSPDATKLPVLLAVSLLKDRNGVIDVNLPVSGSLSDPEFSIGGVIVRVIVNLLAKAVTSPFSLIAHAFGGGDELGYVEFPAGTATLTPEAKKKLDTLGKALNDRPGLKLEISGRIDPATDAAGARRAWLDERVAEEKVREQRKSAQAGAPLEESEEGEQGAKVTVTPQEYPKYLEAVYKRASFKKPRNLIGLAKSLPTAEMEKLLLDNAPVTEAGLRQLAEQRALVVKQVLDRDEKVPESRLFLTSPKLDAEGIKDKGAPTRVDFAIRQ